MTCGVLIWPIVFILTDIMNEYFGIRGVRFISFLTVVLILFAFSVVFIAIQVPPADIFTVSRKTIGIPDMNNAFKAVFSQGLWIISGSLIAFLLGQLIDVFVFQKIKSYTGDKHLWLRATGSTIVSQFMAM